MSEQRNQSPVIMSQSGDIEMENATKQARKTFRYFWREMTWERRRIIPGLDLSCIKAEFSDPPDPSNPDSQNVEFMWVNDVNFDGKAITGTLINAPNWVRSVAVGDKVKIPPKRLSDWMYAIHGKVYGGYTVNLLRSRMGRGERKQHDGAWGLDFGDPAKIKIVPPDFLGQKAPGFLGRLFGGGEAAQDPKQVGEVEHPMAINMMESLEEFVSDNETAMNATDENGFNMLHQLALGGAADSVAILLKHGADPKAKTNNGFDAFTLAKTLGWRKVMEVIASHVKGK